MWEVGNNSIAIKGTIVRWSILAKKQFANHIGIAIQAASDHFRGIGADYHLSSRTSLTETGRDWYYMGRVIWGF